MDSTPFKDSKNHLEPAIEDPLGNSNIRSPPSNLSSNDNTPAKPSRRLTNPETPSVSAQIQPPSWLDLKLIERDVSKEKPSPTKSYDEQGHSASTPLYGILSPTISIQKQDGFYKHAALMQQALMKRPSALDLAHVLQKTNTLEDEFLGESSKPKKRDKLVQHMIEKKEKKDKKDKKDKKVKNGKDKTDQYLDLDDFKESFVPTDEASLKKMREVYQKKNEGAIELRESEKFWKQAQGGYLDVNRYEDDRHKEDEYLKGRLVQYEIDQNVIWRNVIVGEEQNQCIQELKFLIRRGVPDRLRRKIWTTVSGASEFQTNNPTFYQDALQNVFGRNLPSRHIKVPTFGGSLNLDDHFLTQEGKLAAKRVLVVIAMENPDLDFCPILPDLVSLCLHFLTEEETYLVVHLMIKQSTQDKWFFQTNHKSNKAFMLGFNDLLRSRYCKKKNSKRSSHKKLWDHMEMLGIDPIETFTSTWFNRLFVGTLSFQTVLRTFDIYIDEGSATLYRVAMGLLKSNHVKLLQTTNKEEFLSLLNTLVCVPVDHDRLMKISYSIDMTRSDMQKLERKNASGIRTIQLPSHVYYRPKITVPSAIIPDEEFEIIWSFLPDRFRILDPKKLFYTGTDGYNIKALIQKAERHKPTILLIKTEDKSVFGVYISEEFRKDSKAFFGDGECFIFSLHPNERKYSWQPGSPNQFVMVTDKHFSVGGFGQDSAIYLDAELMHGTSAKSPTYQNELLTHQSNFICTALELYSFSY